jgi:aspartyl-tRNA synthetase
LFEATSHNRKYCTDELPWICKSTPSATENYLAPTRVRRKYFHVLKCGRIPRNASHNMMNATMWRIPPIDR